MNIEDIGNFYCMHENQMRQDAIDEPNLVRRK